MTIDVRSIAITWARRLSMIACLVAACGVAAAEDQTTYPLLRESIDPELYKALEAALAEEFRGTRKALVRNKKVSMAVVDINDPMHPRVAAVNGDVMLYAASLP